MPLPVPARGLYEHYHAIFDQMQQQRENIKMAEGREAELREKQAPEPVDRYVCLHSKAENMLHWTKVMKITVHIYLQRTSTWSSSRSS